MGYVVPDAIEPVVGWRSWVIFRDEDGQVGLRSVIRRRNVWPRRTELEAACPYAPEHLKHQEDEYAPAEQCTCGIHASLFPKLVKPYLTSFNGDQIADNDVWRAFGRVSLWGRVIEGDKGWRAQFAYPHSIALPSSAVGCESLSIAAREALAAELRESYGVPVIAEMRLARRLLRR